MAFLIYALIFSGVGIMAFNIVRYRGFIREMAEVDGTNQMRTLVVVPFALLIAFFAGYLFVGLAGQPDLVIAGILFGGSVFVAIVLHVIFRIINLLNESSAQVSARYAQVRENLENLAKNHLSVFRANLTSDVVEERSGSALDETDLRASSFTELQQHRHQRRIGDVGADAGSSQFSRETLIGQFQSGNTLVEENVLLRLAGGQVEFVKIQATLVAAPDTGDVHAFITETLANDEMVNEALLGKALAGQYDMITYLVDGRYGVVIGDVSTQDTGSIFPHERYGEYMQYLVDQVAPVIVGTPEEKIHLMSSLGMNRIERELAVHEPYEVNLACEIDGQVFYKRFVFYTVDASAHFYLLLKSDTTELRGEELERNRQLEEALEKAQQANKSKSFFLSNMSHDIRTPMNAIVGYTDFARKSNDVEQIHRYLNKIDASGKYLLALINDVLEMSRIESGKIDLMPEPVNLAAVARGAHDMLDAEMRDRGIEFTVDTSSMCNSQVLCDKTRLNRVLLNLLSNAYKFTPEGGQVRLSISQTQPAANGFAEYEIRVKDTGIGMSPEFAQRVFDAFERERTSTESGIQGTGLGMAISKRIVDMMDGTIRVETAPGKGTEFIVGLRLPLQDANEQGCDAEPEKKAAPIQADFTGMRALLAEDNDINREIAQMVLEELGFVLDTAANGKEAVDALVAAGPGSYDVLVTDIQMPVMDGFEAAHEIRALDDAQLAAIPIIAMSANAFQEDIRAAQEAGIDGYVAKPIDLNQLVAVLSEVLPITAGNPNPR